MKRKNMKRIFSGMLAFVIAIGGFALITKQTQAAEAEVIKYEVWTSFEDFQTKINSHTAPVEEGYLFGGWYKYNESTGKGTVIEQVTDVTETDTIAAKFIRIDMSGIACQLNLDENDGTRDMRIVSLVDSTNYSAVGFNVYGRKNNEPLSEEWKMYQYGSSSTAEYTKVYAGLNVYENKTTYETKYPADVFGTDATGFKFTTMCLTGVPDTDYDTIVAIKPYWITKDGTYVEGLGEFNRINDYKDGIVNVSVNLKQAANIAGGMLEIAYMDGFEYVGADYGRVFEEMEIIKHADGSIRCVGNVSDVTKNAANPNEVYVNLRFTKTDKNNLKAGEALFTVTVPEKGFCDIEEVLADVYAPSVKY